MSRPDPPSAAHWREVQRLFDAALAQPAATRAAWLATGGIGAALRAEVAALLAGDATPDALLDAPPSARLGAGAAPPAPTPVSTPPRDRPGAARVRAPRRSSPPSPEV
jgi:hypothetical protein